LIKEIDQLKARKEHWEALIEGYQRGIFGNVPFKNSRMKSKLLLRNFVRLVENLTGNSVLALTDHQLEIVKTAPIAVGRKTRTTEARDTRRGWAPSFFDRPGPAGFGRTGRDGLGSHSTTPTIS
jgi:hypothetical protein